MACEAQEQLCQCRMELFADDEGGRRGKKRGFARWEICSQVHRSFWQGQHGEKVVLQCVGRSPLYAQKADARDGKSLPHNRSAWRDDEKCCIKFSRTEGPRGFLSPDRQKVCSLGIDATIGSRRRATWRVPLPSWSIPMRCPLRSDSCSMHVCFRTTIQMGS